MVLVFSSPGLPTILSIYLANIEMVSPKSLSNKHDFMTDTASFTPSIPPPPPPPPPVVLVGGGAVGGAVVDVTSMGTASDDDGGGGGGMIVVVVGGGVVVVVGSSSLFRLVWLGLPLSLPLPPVVETLPPSPPLSSWTGAEDDCFFCCKARSVASLFDSPTPPPPLLIVVVVGGGGNSTGLRLRSADPDDRPMDLEK